MRDIHKDIDKRHISIDFVGIDDLELPLNFNDDGYVFGSVVKVKAGVFLDQNSKGAHLSRIIEVLDNSLRKELSLKDLQNIYLLLKEKNESQNAGFTLNFKYPYEVVSPVTNKSMIMMAEISLNTYENDKNIFTDVEVKTNGMMLCPCSKEISKYGAHNQRCELKAILCEVESDSNLKVRDIIDLCVKQYSCPVYSLIKREDEKYVTEKSYDNPKFSEDLIRDTLISLKDIYHKKIIVELKNFESIHQHNVVARGIINV